LPPGRYGGPVPRKGRDPGDANGPVRESPHRPVTNTPLLLSGGWS